MAETELDQARSLEARDGSTERDFDQARTIPPDLRGRRSTSNASHYKEGRLKECVQAVVDEYSEGEISKSIVDCLIEKNILGDLDGEARKNAEKAISQHLKEKFPVIGEIAKLRLHYHFELKGGRKHFPANGSWETHIRTYYNDAVSAGFLPISQISDLPLRRSLSQGKSKNRLPPQLAEVCRTKQEVLTERRTAVAAILGLTNPATLTQKFVSFVSTFRPQND